MLTKPKKKTKKPKAPSLSSLKEKVWQEFSLFIRLRDAKRFEELFPESHNTVECVTCKKPYPATGVGCAQAGHFIPGRKNAYLFDERQVRAQCYNCNLRLKGNWPPYLEYMEDMFGKEAVDHMRLVQRYEIVSFTHDELIEKRAYYKTKVTELKEQLCL